MARRLADSDRQRSKEWADKISVSLRGHPVSQETRRKISEARAGKPVPSRQGMHYKEEVGYMRFVRAPELAELLGIPVRTIYDCAKRDEWPTYRVGKVVRFDLDEILALIKDES
jgi:excisionase family DNA binding protein